MQPGGALKELAVDIAGIGPSGTDSMADSVADTAPSARTWGRDEAAEVVALHFDFIWRLLRRLGVSESEVDDATQQVFLTATSKELRGGAARARPFLYGVALRVAANFRRTARRR